MDNQFSAAQSTSSHRFHIPGRVVKRLTGVVDGVAASTDTVLVTAVATLLARFTAENEVSVQAALPTRSSPSRRWTSLDITVSSTVPFHGLVTAVSQAEPGAGAGPTNTATNEVVAAWNFGAPSCQVQTELREAHESFTSLEGKEPCPVGFTFVWHDGGVEGELQIDREILPAFRPEDLAAALPVLLTAAADHPSCAVGRLPLVAAGERDRLVEQWSGSAQEVPRATFVELFAAQAARSGDGIAVEYEGGVLTYAELLRATAQLAWSLRERGVGRGSLVGVLMDRGPEAMISILAVMAAGGAFVPLDPEYPRERLDFMVGDSGAGLLLTTGAWCERVQPGSVPVVCVEQEWEAAAAHPQELPPVSLCPEDLAYVIYTSGSTGVPKGNAA